MEWDFDEYPFPPTGDTSWLCWEITFAEIMSLPETPHPKGME